MSRLFSAIVDWITVAIPDACSGWLLQAYRRPFGFLLAVVILPLGILFAAAQTVNTGLWRRQTLHNLHVTARLASEIVDETLGETVRFEQTLAADPSFAEALKRKDRVALSGRLRETMAFLPRVDLATAINAEGVVVASFPVRPELTGRIVRLMARSSTRCSCGRKRRCRAPKRRNAYERERKTPSADRG